jgi:integrase
MQVRLKFINTWTDHLGRQRYRFRRRGFPHVELPVDSDPNSPEFMSAYTAALRGERVDDAIAAVTARGGSGTVVNAIEQFLNSTTFKGSADGTQAQRRPILKSVARLVGKLPLVKMDEGWVLRWLETASTANAKANRFAALKAFTKWAVDMKFIAEDPCTGIKVKTAKSDGHHTWILEEIEQYRARHPVGTMARLALELLLTATARRGDGIALGRQHVRNGWLVYTQEKNRKRKPMTVEIPIPASLAAAIEACPSPPEALTFLTNEWGRPFGKKSFNTQFRKWCDEAGLPERCVPHGLRKGGATLMGNSGCTVHEIAAVTGHRTLKEVQRYTEAYDRKQAAVRAQAKVAAAKDNVVPLKVAAER